ncbi:MAG: GNAT family N-acetyltransferase [Oscillospiraceae bacterium]|nr:GNAT family N-acetyltransferase [Oscillospiraceae bacterium]
MKLLTKRCLIRNFRLEDADDLYQVLSDRQVMKHVEPVFNMEKTKAFIETAGLCEPPLVYAIVWNATGKVIGHAIFHIYEGSSYEIGWILSRDHWGMGIADEVTKALIGFAAHAGADSCVIECSPQQIASRKIAAKNGFTYEGETDNLERYRLTLPKTGLCL